MLALVIALGLNLAQPPGQAAIEQEARQIERLLIAPCCWTQPVSDHYSAEADEIRAGVRRMLAAGQTRRQVLEAYVAQYGDRILAEPPARGFRVSLYVLPWIVLALGGAVVFGLVRRVRAARPVEVPAPSPGAAPRQDVYEERLDEELRGLD